MSRYLKGADVLGASDQYVAIRFQDVGGLVRQQGGRSGGVAYAIAPKMITHMAYDKMREQIAQGLAQKGIMADVTVEASPSVLAQDPEFVRGVLIGAAVTGAGIALYKYLIKYAYKGKR